jgi:RHS repeat-associated protein
MVVEYTYDSEGRRVEVTDAQGKRDVVVAPTTGGLESPFLIVQENDVEAVFAYAGDMPLARVDEAGNPVYYLTDAMGSVIGLVDGNGNEIADFRYDGFGNLQTSEALSEGLGGDFRFQGQWLESNTDLYHFRARYYDPETGRFVSRDPVEVIETVPESSNPYQFVYNNPLVYSDPSGKISIMELNARDSVQNVLNGIKFYTKQELKEQLVSGAQRLAADAFFSAIETFVPIDFFNSSFSASSTRRIQQFLSRGAGRDFNLAGVAFEVFLKSAFCEFLPESLHSKIFFEPDVNANGHSTHPGYQCPQVLSRRVAAGVSRPDFIVTPDRPRTWRQTEKRSYLIGDIKLSLKTVVEDYFGGTGNRNRAGSKRDQWDAMVEYAQKNGTRTLAFPTLFAGKKHERSVLRQKVVKEAAKAKVIVFTVSAQ